MIPPPSEDTSPERSRYPLSAREDPRARADHDEPHDGVPSWLEPSLWAWVHDRITYVDRGTKRMRWDTLRKFERYAKWQVTDVAGATVGLTLSTLRGRLRGKPVRYLDLVDFLLADLPNGSRSHEDLDAFLREAGSAWVIDTSARPYVLVSRVGPEFQALHAAAVREASESTGELLALAWRAIYQRDPHSSDGYRTAVRSCEAALVPLTLPEDPSATLGKVIAHLDQARRRWTIDLPGDPNRVNAQDTFVALLRHIWTGQYDRHVTEGAPLHVAQHEAERALLLTVQIVQLVTTGAFSHE